MAPAADMFEMGVKVQVLKRGTMFAMRAAKLYELYRNHDSLEQIPEPDRAHAREDALPGAARGDLGADHAVTSRAATRPRSSAGERDPKHKMALVFRWYLGQSSHWANVGEPTRSVDYQVWCGPAMAAFNEWVRGSFLEPPENRRVVDGGPEHPLRRGRADRAPGCSTPRDCACRRDARDWPPWTAVRLRSGRGLLTIVSLPRTVDVPRTIASPPARNDARKGSDLTQADSSQPVPVAIIGMGCLFPMADDLARFWSNIRGRLDAITEVPPTHWRPEDYWDEDPKAADRTYARRGGFLTPVDFPLLDFGIAPHTVEATDTTQLLGLLVARQALIDAGYGPDRDFERDRVSVILGVTGTLELVIPLGARLGHPIWRRALREAGVDDADGRGRRPADRRVLRRLAGELVPRPAGQRGRRPDRQPAGPGRDQLRGRRRLRQLAGRGEPGHARAGRRPLRRGPLRRARYVQRHFHVHVLQQDAGPVALGRRPAVRRRRGRHDPGRGAGDPGAQAAGGRPARRRPDLRGDPLDGDLERRQGAGGLRPQRRAGRSRRCARPTSWRASRPARSSWSRPTAPGHEGGRRDRAGGARAGLPRGQARGSLVRPGLDQVAGRAHQGRGRGRGPDQGRPGASSQGLAADDQGQPADRVAGRGRLAVLSQHRDPALAARAAAIPAGRRSAPSASAAATSIACSRRPIPRCPGSTGEATSRSWPTRPTTRTGSAAGCRGGRARSPGPTSGRKAARSRAAFRREHRHRLVLVARRGETEPGPADRGGRGQAGRCRRARRTPGTSRRHGRVAASIASSAVGPAPGALAMLFPVRARSTWACSATWPAGSPPCRPRWHSGTTPADRRRPQAQSTGSIPRRLSRGRPPTPGRGPARHPDRPAGDRRGLAGAAPHPRGFRHPPRLVGGHSFGELTALHAAGRIDEPTLARLSLRRGALMADCAGSDDPGAMLAVFAPLDQVASLIQEHGLDLVIANKNAPRSACSPGRAPRSSAPRGLFDGRADHCPARWRSRRRFTAGSWPRPAPRCGRSLAAVDLKPGDDSRLRQRHRRASIPDDAETARDLLADQLCAAGRVRRPDRGDVPDGGTDVPGGRARLEATGLVRSILEGRDHRAIGGRRVAGATARRQPGRPGLALANLAALGYPVELKRWDEGYQDPRRRPQRKSLTVKVCGANPAQPCRDRIPITSLQVGRMTSPVCQRSPTSPDVDACSGTRIATPTVSMDSQAATTSVQRSPSGP